jgi:hypothetical protein
MNDHDPTVNPPPEAPPMPPAPSPAPATAPPPPARVAATPQLKVPGLAAVLSIVPGLPIGQLYGEAFDRAVMIAGAFWLLILAAVQGALPVTLVVFACIFIWIYSMFDAYRQAHIVNMGGAEPTPVSRSRGEGRLMFGIFLAVVGGLLLVENLGLFDLYWLRDWWPVFVLLIGVYLIFEAVRERMRRGGSADVEEGGGLDD